MYVCCLDLGACVNLWNEASLARVSYVSRPLEDTTEQDLDQSVPRLSISIQSGDELEKNKD